MQMYGIGSEGAEDIHENTISVMWVGWILHHLENNGASQSSSILLDFSV